MLHPDHKPNTPLVLVACECSGTVRDAFIARGIDAISCDIKPTRVPGPHFMCDMFLLDLNVFDLVIAFPPYTAICTSGNGHYRNTAERVAGAEFFKRIWDSPVAKLAIENPVNIINGFYPSLPKPYYIQPYYFGHPVSKKTGIWSRGLPQLEPERVLTPHPNNGTDNYSGKGEALREARSNTFFDVAKAMAKQWGDILLEEYSNGRTS